jgi:hypothetical protein
LYGFRQFGLKRWQRKFLEELAKPIQTQVISRIADAILCKSGGVLRPLLWSREQSWALSRTGYLQDNRDDFGSNIRLSLRTTAQAAFNTESHLTVEWERAHREGQQQ